MRCCVPFCKNTTDGVSSSARNGLTFHGFPHDVRLRAAWLRALGKQDSHLPDSAVVCSQHFQDDDIYETENGLRQICTDAIPSMVQVCMICLDTDSKLFLMSKHKLEEAYEKLIGHPVYNQANLKQTLCVQCAQKLINFSRFRDKSLRARALMMDLVEKHELITIKYIKMISRTKHKLKSNFEVKMLGPDHCDLYIQEDASEDEQTESLPSPFTTSLRFEATVQGVVVKNEEMCDSLADQDIEMPNEDTNNADSSSEFVASNEHLLSDNSIMLETRLMDGALCKVLEGNLAVSEQVPETMVLVKCESVPLECTLCSEEFVGEHEYMQHMDMHGQNVDGDTGCDTSQVWKPNVSVRSSHSSSLTENKQDIQQLKDDPHPSADSAQTSVTPSSTRLARKIGNNVLAEADTVQKSILAFKISNEQLLRQSTCNKSITDAKLTANCVVKLYDVFKLRVPKKGAPIQEESLEDSRTSITCCESQCHIQCQSVSQNEKVTHTLEDNEPVTSKVKVNKRNVSKTLQTGSYCFNYGNSKHSLLVEKNWFTCDLCNNMFQRKTLLVRHMETHADRNHTREPYSCELCEYKCAKNSLLLKHMKTHTNVKPYSCKLCKYKCIRKYALVSHMRTHTSEKPYSCEFCDYKCLQKSNLARHIRTHTGEKPYSCKLCKYKCVRKHVLVSHMRTHTREKPYSCEFCDYKCIQKSNLARHVRTHTGEKPYSCKLCKYKCVRKYVLVSHMRTHTSEKPYSCEFCDYICLQKSNLARHIRTHTGEKPYSCKLCKYKCVRKHVLVSHMRTHTSEKPYSCEFCDYKCIQKSNLSRHVRTHTGEKPYSCMLCEYKCIQKGDLLSHMRTHTGEKPYSCEFCDYKSIQKSNLARHMRTHTGEKPYSCMLCEYKCMQKSDLVTHMRTHTGEKPYSCTFCKYNSSRKDNLVSHMRTHTGEKCMLCEYKCIC